MKAGDVYAGQTSSRESWLSAPLSDPNAALWASITPPANPNIATLVRRRAAAFSLELLAQRLYLRFPGQLSSRATARTLILSAAVAVGAAFGAAGILTLKAQLAGPVAVGPAALGAALQPVAIETSARSVPARRGQTEVSEPARGPATTALSAPHPAAATHPAATHPASDTTEQSVQPLRPAAAAADLADQRGTPAKAKHGATKKRSKPSARRAGKRRTRGLD